MILPVSWTIIRFGFAANESLLSEAWEVGDSLLPGGSFLDDVASFTTPLHGDESLVELSGSMETRCIP